MRITIIALLVLFTANAFAATATTNYFSCSVFETTKAKKKVEVLVKFAVRGLDMMKEKGELIQYPGSEEDMGMISVTCKDTKHVATMANLNGQGGDLRIEGNNLRLWGDGDGYQFTDLVIWDVDTEATEFEGYVRDYGPAYGDNKMKTFKQFITCKRSEKVL